MGLAVLPARLKIELNEIKEHLLNGDNDISAYESLEKHADWYKEILNKYDSINQSNVENILKEEVGLKFLEVLCHAGVFKRNEKGLAAFDKFVSSLNF